MSRKYTKNELVFDVINTEEKAYWIGFLAADGHVDDSGRLNLKLSSKDVNHLEKFRKFIEYTGPIEIRKCQLGKSIRRFGKQNIYETALLRISSKKICDDVAKYGVIPRKSLILNYPITFPSEIERHYIRGYIDGDGNWTVNSFKYNDATLTILSTDSFLRDIQSVFLKNKLINHVYSHTTPSKIHSLAIRGRRIVSSIAEWLYSDATVFLKRKRDYLIINGIIDNNGNRIVKVRRSYEKEKNPNAKTFIFTSPLGTKFEVVGKLKQFCKIHGLSYEKSIHVANGTLDNVNGWRVKKVLTT